MSERVPNKFSMRELLAAQCAEADRAQLWADDPMLSAEARMYMQRRADMAQQVFRSLVLLDDHQVEILKIVQAAQQARRRCENGGKKD